MLLTALDRHHQHPLLRFAEEDLVRRHPFLTQRHLRHVDLDADVATGRHLGRGTRQAGRAHVLDRDDMPAANELERRLEEQLLGEGVAHLDARPLGVALVREILGSE